MIEKEKLFQNRIIDKKQLKQIMSWAFTNYGIVKASFLADQLKDLGFKKIKTEPGLFMYELDPATMRTPSKMTITINKPQAASNKPQASSSKQQVLDKSK
jgi:hypothetical protein